MLNNIISSSYTRLFTLIIISLLGIGACNGQMEDQEVSETLTDDEITEAIISDLAVTRGINAELITVETEEGIVTLAGEAINILTKQRASRVASSIRGVSSVINNIEVTSTRDDSAISEGVDEALLADPVTETWAIENSVNDGIVTLTGSVDSWQEKELAAKVAKGVKGVIGVNNNINVEYDGDRSPFDIEQDVIYSLAWDIRIDDALIEVSVNQDTVALDGAVGSLYEKNLALAKSYVAGVQYVDTSDLEVKSWLRDDMLKKDFMADKTDEDIEEAIEKAWGMDPRVNSDRLEVDVQDGKAEVTGTISNLKSARAAISDVKNTNGIVTVDDEVVVVNNIVVEPDNGKTDAQIELDAEQALIRDPYTELLDITVSIDNGRATLSGSVDTYFEKYHADDVVARVGGVTEVNNELVVDYEEYSFQEEYYDWDPVDYDYDYNRMSKTDAELKEDIKKQMYWSPFLNGNAIEIQVNDGVATLEGVVRNFNHIAEATEEAYEAGAVEVINNLDYQN